MKYYVIADPHGFYDITMKTLEESGFFTDPEPCKLIVCGDLLDRGDQPDEMQRLMAGLLKQDRLIFIRGNHGIPVPDYTEELVSTKVVKIIQSYTGVVDKMVWRKF